MYESFYGLTGKPFQLNPDPAFYFGSRGHKRAFAYLQYGVYQSEGFIVITGEIGAGKTTIVMLRSVSAAFGLPAKAVDKATLLASLEAFLCQLAIDGKRALLVVDEAQNLTPRAVEELRMLSNFQLGEQALLQSFLIGQPELRDMMHGQQMQQLRQRVIASYHLGPMDKAETQAYIEHRLVHVGWKGDPSIDAAAFELIYTLSGGIPRRINTICNRLLLAGYLQEKHAFGTDDVQAIAREIREELGPETALASVAVARAREAATAPAAMLQDAGAVLARLREMDERIDRLEKTVGSAVDLLHRLLHPDRNSKPRAPASR